MKSGENWQGQEVRKQVLVEEDSATRECTDREGYEGQSVEARTIQNRKKKPKGNIGLCFCK